MKHNRPQLRTRPFGPSDAPLLAALVLALAWLAYRLIWVYPYNWDWAAIPQFLVHRDEGGGWSLGILGQGLMMTLRLSLWTALGALSWGLALALGRLSFFLYPRLLARAAVEGARNMPPLVLIFVFYYFLLGEQLIPWPRLTAHLAEAVGPAGQAVIAFLAAPVDTLSNFIPAVLALALYEGAYFAEIFRGGIMSIPQGQWEAARCLGLSRYQQYRYVVLPQVFRRVAPQLAGQFISTVKDSSIVSVISLSDLTYSGQRLVGTIHQPFEVWLTVAAIYFLLNYPISRRLTGTA